MSDYEKPQAGPTGWTESIWPTMARPYRLGCCDCGLVHDIQFGHVKLANPRDLGGYRPVRIRGGIAGHPLYPAKSQRGRHAVQVTMLVRRNEAETARMRARDVHEKR